MNIYEAMALRNGDKPCISRLAWTTTEKDGSLKPFCKIRPTYTSDNCIIEAKAAKAPCHGWQPMAEDLEADDWFTTN